jgi:hypothetical protein
MRPSSYWPLALSDEDGTSMSNALNLNLFNTYKRRYVFGSWLTLEGVPHLCESRLRFSSMGVCVGFLDFQDFAS